MEIAIKSKAHGDKVLQLDEKDFHIIEGHTISIQKGRATFYAKTAKAYIAEYKNIFGKEPYKINKL